MNTNERPRGDKLSFSITAQLYLELQAEKDRTRQLEKRLRRVERKIAGLCFMIYDAGAFTHSDTTRELADQVETLTEQVEALSQAMSSSTGCKREMLDEGGLQNPAPISSVPPSVVNVIFLGNPADCGDAEKILASLSPLTNPLRGAGEHGGTPS